jgi:murein DD-endopeptidase MepM/ murein hydrolase activator NlpD
VSVPLWKRLGFLTALLALGAGVFQLLSHDWSSSTTPAPSTHTNLSWSDFFGRNLLNSLPVADGFDFPVRPPDGKGTYIARQFWEKNHLGEDWNTAEKNLDLGEPIYACGDGWVSTAMNFEGMWGNVVLVVSRLPAGRWPPAVEMMYAHLQTIEVKPMTFVKRGQRLGTMGNADGVYYAHLHWEVRQTVGLGLGGGYGERRDGWMNPTEFVLAHRPPGAGPDGVRALPQRQKESWGED